MAMQKSTFTSSNGTTEITYFTWAPSVPARGVVQIVHGMCEYMGRYEELAEHLADKGFVVCGEDHLGHGQSVGEHDTFGYFGKNDGDRYLVEDVEKLHRIMMSLYPGKPYIVLGHSMGSFITRNWFTQYGDDCDGIILSGTARNNSLVGLLIALAKFQRFFVREKKPAKLISRTINKQYMKRIAEPFSASDWLSYDKEIVKKYSGDPFCTFTFTHSAYIDLFHMLRACNSDEWYGSIPKNKPILLISGDEDPVGDYGEGPQEIYDKLQAAGQDKVTLDIRHGMRHEPHNEIGRDAVYERLAAYLIDNFARKVSPG
ncbi:MAG: lysophospholipase [Clostridiales bacterium]|nr:lysophospholipase [Candidatus Scatonaster coprocaballi]